MKITIGDRETSRVSVHDRWSWDHGQEPPIVPYTLKVSRENIGRDFGGYYQDYLADEKLYGDEESEALPRRLAQLDWPSLEDLMAREPRLCEQFLLEVAYDLLQTLFLDFADETPRYFICSVTEVALGPSEVTFWGTAVDFKRQRLDAALDNI